MQPKISQLYLKEAIQRGLYHDGHKPWRPQQWRPQTITAPKEVHDGHTEDYDGQTMTATNNDGQIHDGHKR